MSYQTAWPIEHCMPSKRHATLTVQPASQDELRRWQHSIRITIVEHAVWCWGRLARYERLSAKRRTAGVAR